MAEVSAAIVTDYVGEGVKVLDVERCLVEDSATVGRDIGIAVALKGACWGMDLEVLKTVVGRPATIVIFDFGVEAANHFPVADRVQSQVIGALSVLRDLDSDKAGILFDRCTSVVDSYARKKLNKHGAINATE